MFRLRNFANYLAYGWKNGQFNIFSFVIDLIILILAIYEFNSELNEYLSTKPILSIIVLFLFNIVWQGVSISKDFVQYFSKQYSNEYVEQNVDFTEFVSGNNEIIETINKNSYSYNEEICEKLSQNNEFRCTNYKAASKKVDDYIRSNFLYLLPFINKHYKDSQANNKLFTNDPKLCLYGELTVKDDNVHLCKGFYYNTYLTNKIFLKSLISNDTSDVYPIHGCSNRKVKLPFEYFSNEIGVSTLAITLDGYLFLQVQGTHADSSAGLIVPSGSGSADWQDYTKNRRKNIDSLEEIISYATKRELAEETGNQQKDPDQIVSKSKIIGFFRWLNFGGKPEFVSLSILNQNRDDIKPQSSEQQPISDSYCFKIITKKNSIDYDELDKCWKIMDRPNCSLPLYVNLKMLKHYIENHEEEFKHFCGIDTNLQEEE